MPINRNILGLLILTLATLSCTREAMEPEVRQDDWTNVPISLSGGISQVYETRADNGGFADGDAIGVYITDYSDNESTTLSTAGNRADNMKYTFSQAEYKWTPIREIYWKDKVTHIDVYGYYPFQNSIDDVSSVPFMLSSDQNLDGSDGELGGYEASDFLWGKTEDVAPTDKQVNVSLHHKMAGIRVTLVEGTGFADGEWTTADKQVLILGTKNNAVIDLSTGSVLATGDIASTGISPYRSGSDWRAVVVPQEIAAGTNLIRVTIGGYAYKHTIPDGMTLLSGKQHNFTITVNKHANGALEFILTGESVTAWEKDNASHNIAAEPYLVINVDIPGTLDSCLTSKVKDLSKVQNLKLEGIINAKDFLTMRNKMSSLSHLNLKDVQISGVENMSYGSTSHLINMDNEIPLGAFLDKTSLIKIILPDKLKGICPEAFSGCTGLTGSLVIPEGVEIIDDAAFYRCTSFDGELVLPESLNYIGNSAFDNGFSSSSSSFTGNLRLSNNIYYIGPNAFARQQGLSGNLELPESLTYLGPQAFLNCSGFYGDLVLPAGITEIGHGTFEGCSGLKGSLSIPNGVTRIGDQAFKGCGFKKNLSLPSSVESIGDMAFYYAGFSGNLVLPENLQYIGSNAFIGCGFSGDLDVPSGIQSVPANAFAGLSYIEKISIPKYIQGIGQNAFSGCYRVNSIVCEALDPPTVEDGAFDGVPKDNFTLEVPAEAVVAYKTTPGWSDFKRISAYRNLSVDPGMASAINSSVTRTFTLYADEDWEVQSQPDWVTLSQTEGTGKTEMQVTFYEMPSGSNRTGEVVFKLKAHDYTTSLSVSQYDYSYEEDEIVTLQSATKGSGVNLMFLGDGYSAKDVSEGTLLKDINEAVDYFFAIEPYKSYKDYFNVYTAVSVSPESGIGSVNTIVYNRFNTTAKSGVTLGGRNDSDYTEIFKYACKAPTISESNLGQTLVVVIPNTTDYGGITYMYGDGSAIAYCPKSTYAYPRDFRGIVQHEAGGHGFGKLGDEYIYYNGFVDDNTASGIRDAKRNGWYDNLSLSGKPSDVTWSHLIYHENYKDRVDIYEGGCQFTRGVFRSEENSCMNRNIPYYSAISREAIVKRIKAIAGESYSFEDFVANDKIEYPDENGNLSSGSTASTKSASPFSSKYSLPSIGPSSHHGPVFMGERPRL